MDGVLVSNEGIELFNDSYEDVQVLLWWVIDWSIVVFLSRVCMQRGKEKKKKNKKASQSVYMILSPCLGRPFFVFG